MHAETLDLAALTSTDIAEWRQLAARAVEPNPFFEPEYLLPLARALDPAGEARLVVVRGSGAWQACTPVHSARRWFRIPIRTIATWRGHPLYGLLGTPLLAPDDPEQALSVLVAGMAEADRRARFVALEWIAEDGPLGESLARLMAARDPAPVAFERFERAVLRRRPEPDYLEQTLSSKHRRELRRQRRKLGEALGSEPELVNRAGDAAAYADFVAMESAAGKAEQGTVLAHDPAHVAFFEEMCRGFAELGRLQLLELQGGDQTVAAKCNLVAGDTIFFFKIAYGESWSSFSPGILLEVEMLKYFHEDAEIQLMDSCADSNNSMINRLWPDRRPIATYALPAPGPAGRAVRPALVAGRSLRDRYRKRRDG